MFQFITYLTYLRFAVERVAIIYTINAVFAFFVLHERQDNNIFVWIVIVSLE